MAWSSAIFLGAGAVLMSAHNGAVDHRVIVVGSLGQMLKDALPDTGFGPAGKAAVHVFAVAEALRQVAPGDTGAIAVEYGVDKQTVVRSGHANRTGPTRQQVLDPVPLVIAESVSAHRSAFPKRVLAMAPPLMLPPKLTAYESKNHRRGNRETACLPMILPHRCKTDSPRPTQLTTRPSGEGNVC
jgi:hypothetical protein